MVNTGYVPKCKQNTKNYYENVGFVPVYKIQC